VTGHAHATVPLGTAPALLCSRRQMGCKMIVRGGRAIYGETVGILVLDTKFPRIPGDVANATTFGFPVRYTVVDAAGPDQIVAAQTVFPDRTASRTGTPSRRRRSPKGPSHSAERLFLDLSTGDTCMSKLTALIGFIFLVASSAWAQTPPAGDAGAGGGIRDYWWIILLVIIIAAAVWYFTQSRRV
jgi:hypothetical protein